MDIWMGIFPSAGRKIIFPNMLHLLPACAWQTLKSTTSITDYWKPVLCKLKRIDLFFFPVTDFLPDKSSMPSPQPFSSLAIHCRDQARRWTIALEIGTKRFKSFLMFFIQTSAELHSVRCWRWRVPGDSFSCNESARAYFWVIYRWFVKSAQSS